MCFVSANVNANTYLLALASFFSLDYCVCCLSFIVTSCFGGKLCKRRKKKNQRRPYLKGSGGLHLAVGHDQSALDQVF